MKEEDRDWASIPGDLLRTIAERVGSLEDYVRFGAVCQSWHSSTTCSLNNNSKSIFFPWLMLPEKEDSDMRGFYNISSGKIFEIELPEIRGKKYWGSPFGWLITYGLDLDIHLFNPLSRICLPLPSQRTFTNQYRESLSPKFLRNRFIYKILLSKSPDFIAMAIYSDSRKLAFAKPGDDTWRPMQCVEANFHDIIYFDGNFFAVENFGNVLICEDLYGHNPVAVEFAAPPPVKDRFKKYLVDLGGDLCLVCRNIVCLIPYDTEGVKELYKTDYFEIFKLDMHTRKWEQVLS